MNKQYFRVRQSFGLSGTLEVSGAKNAILVSMCSALLAKGVSKFFNVPALLDVFSILDILNSLGAQTFYDAYEKSVTIDTTNLSLYEISEEKMRATRASILFLAPLLAHFGKATLGLPGGDSIGARPIDFHIKNLKKLGAVVEMNETSIGASVVQFVGTRLVLDYPSIGATENILMAAVKADGRTTLVNAALEPEVLFLIAVLKKMGALIEIQAPATIVIDGVAVLRPAEHSTIPDRLEAGAVLIAAAMTQGDVYIPNIQGDMLDLILLKLEEMGNVVERGQKSGVRVKGRSTQKAVSFKTSPFPGFATDLQPPLMAALLTAQGTSVIEETVFENRFRHIPAFLAMGANIDHVHSNKAVIRGVSVLQGVSVYPTDIRAACALVLAGLVAHGQTNVFEIHHFKRGFDLLEERLYQLGADICLVDESSDAAAYQIPVMPTHQIL
jgi:UDP-N-acetylglucosamine 1-carboxyvinyltransferase